MKAFILKWTIIGILFACNCVQIVELRRFREETEATLKYLNAEINLAYDRDTNQCEMISRLAQAMAKTIEALR